MTIRKINIKYVKSHDYKAGVSSGVYGGITTNGLINANFYLDRTIIPTHEIYDVDDSGQIIGQPITEKDGDLIREVQFGTLLDIETAKNVIEWLSTKIKEQESSPL